jgi:hypothetical protein
MLTVLMLSELLGILRLKHCALATAFPTPPTTGDSVHQAGTSSMYALQRVSAKKLIWAALSGTQLANETGANITRVARMGKKVEGGVRILNEWKQSPAVWPAFIVKV